MEKMQNTKIHEYKINEKTAHRVTLAEYIWLDGSGQNLRSKTKVYLKPINHLADLEWWTYDGSSTGQATTEESEIWIKPAFMCADPFREGFGILVLCEGYLKDRVTPAKGNFRWVCEKVMKDAEHEKPWFGIEQEYFLAKLHNGVIETVDQAIGYVEHGKRPQGSYYCAIGEENTSGRPVAEAHIRYCLSAGLKIAGLNSEVAPGQWEFQVGIAEGMEGGDHLWVARYILQRIAEEFGYVVIFHPKPFTIGDFNGSGCHTNYSTDSTRREGGMKHIIEHHMPALAEHHEAHIAVYGSDNELRLSGKFETSSIKSFSYGVGSRGCSVRIPVMTEKDGKGYYEDRRPASNMNPYIVTALVVDTTVLKSKYQKDLVVSQSKFRKSKSHIDYL